MCSFVLYKHLSKILVIVGITCTRLQFLEFKGSSFFKVEFKLCKLEMETHIIECIIIYYLQHVSVHVSTRPQKL